MSDDEEVVLRSSELHKYMKINNIGNLNRFSGFETSESDTNCATSAKDQCAFLINISDADFLNSHKPNICNYTSNIIYTIIKSGLLYPDHIMEIEKYLNLENIEPKQILSISSTIFHSSFIFAVTSTMTLVPKRVKALGYLGVLLTSVFYSSKVFTIMKQHHEIQKVKHFVKTIDNFFSTSKRTFSFILESEFLLRSKLVKGQPFYILSNGWVNVNSVEELKDSDQVLLELRKMLSDSFLNVAITFCHLTKFMRRELPLKLGIDSDDNYTELPDNITSLYTSLYPSLEDLKKLNNIYLLTQSECLRRLILSFIKDFWMNNFNHAKLKNVTNEVTSCISKFNLYADNLKLFYARSLKLGENSGIKIKRNTFLKVKNTNDKVFVYIKNFLTKADAHMLSLLLDLRMLNDWFNECEENYSENYGDDLKILTTFQEKLTLMKGNIELFCNFYNDNCNLLKNLVNRKSFVNLSDDSSVPDEVLSDNVKKTGIEVGKSDFDFSGQDEVLISLSNNGVVNDCNNDLQDYDEQDVQKCLPKNVLIELKCALQGKKEEWIEREKKALSSKIDIDYLDFDSLSNTNVTGHDKFILNNDKECRKHGKTSRNCNFYVGCGSELSTDEDEANLQLHSKNNISENKSSTESKSVYLSLFNDITFIRNSNHENSEADTLKDTNKDLSELDGSGSQSENYVPSNRSGNEITKSSHNSFLDQIKSAHKSFNLAMKEEFIEEIIDE
ncbi:uncharacterized protein LOC142320653 [Lycorma delicatula]|uniref:uncharacterized protein LOC142320653 n=1 Tax=Lycorma delicatula TaxID=130591 RepID=UPI003F519183